MVATGEGKPARIFQNNCVEKRRKKNRGICTFRMKTEVLAVNIRSVPDGPPVMANIGPVEPTKSAELQCAQCGKEKEKYLQQ